MITKDLKPKNKALKAKLIEKVNIIEVLERDFTNYKKQKEITIDNLIEANKKLNNERNLIINELVNNNNMNNFSLSNSKGVNSNFTDTQNNNNNSNKEDFYLKNSILNNNSNHSNYINDNYNHFNENSNNNYISDTNQ